MKIIDYYCSAWPTSTTTSTRNDCVGDYLNWLKTNSEFDFLYDNLLKKRKNSDHEEIFLDENLEKILDSEV